MTIVLIFVDQLVQGRLTADRLPTLHPDVRSEEQRCVFDDLSGLSRGFGQLYDGRS